VAATSVQFTADETGNSQFLRGNRRNLAEEGGVERKISPPKRVAGVPKLSNDQGERAGNLGKEDCCSGFSERVCQFITGKSSVTSIRSTSMVGAGMDSNPFRSHFC